MERQILVLSWSAMLGDWCKMWGGTNKGSLGLAELEWSGEVIWAEKALGCLNWVMKGASLPRGQGKRQCGHV